MDLSKFLFFLFLICSTFSLYAQEASPASAKIYLDCSPCNDNFIKQEVNIIDYVRDRMVADIHILVTSQPMASGGRLFKINFIGLREEFDQNFTIELNTYQTDSNLEVNQKLARVIKAGLMPFLITKGLVKMEVIREEQSGVVRQVSEEDPWDFWVFEIGGNVNWRKESNQSELRLSGEIKIERTTELWRVRSRLGTRYEVNTVKREEGPLVSSLSRTYAEASAVRSITEFWSTGAFVEGFSDTYNNVRVGSGLHAAIEYSLFPYRMSATKEFTISYRVGPRYFNYREETIFDEQKEYLVQHAMRADLNLREPWGNIFARLEGSQYLHDLSKNRLALRSNLSLQVVQGLFVRFGGGANLVNDQIFLPKGEVSLEEILLNRRALPTAFEVDFYFGIAYTFGSIYSSVVNTRL